MVKRLLSRIAQQTFILKTTRMGSASTFLGTKLLENNAITNSYQDDSWTIFIFPIPLQKLS